MSLRGGNCIRAAAVRRPMHLDVQSGMKRLDFPHCKWGHMYPQSTDLNSSWMAGSTGTAERGKQITRRHLPQHPLPQNIPEGGRQRSECIRQQLPQHEGDPEGPPGSRGAWTYLEPLWTVCDDASPRHLPPSGDRVAGGQCPSPTCQGQQGAAAPWHCRDSV